MISPQAATEPEYTLEKKGHTSVIRVSYPGPGGSSDIGDNAISEQVVHESNKYNPDVTTSSTPPGSRTPDGAVGLSSFQPVRPRDSPSQPHRPSLPIRSDASMGLDSFHFVAVLGRGHFGKVILAR